MATEIVIIAAVIVTAVLVLVLIVAVWRRTQNKKDAAAQHVGVVGMEGIMIETTKRRINFLGLYSPPEIDRAQKFRERARSTTIGRPEFKVTHKKSSKKDIYQTLGNHPDFEAFKQQLPPRRTSEDTTSHVSEPDTPKDITSFEEYLVQVQSDSICTDV